MRRSSAFRRGALSPPGVALQPRCGGGGGGGGGRGNAGGGRGINRGWTMSRYKSGMAALEMGGRPVHG